MANNHQPPKQSIRHNYYAEQLTTWTDVTNLIKDNTRQVYPFNIVDIKNIYPTGTASFCHKNFLQMLKEPSNQHPVHKMQHLLYCK